MSSSMVTPAIENFWRDAQISLKDSVHLEEGRGVKVFYLLLTIFIAQNVWLALSRLYLSPLAKIPGPKLAALTGFYESYYDVCLGGQYFKRVAEMHKQYGPIVRITPNEVHWNDPDFIDSVFPGSSRKTNRPEWTKQRTGTPYSIVSTPDHDLHRRRRNALNSFFSVASVRRLEPLMKMCMAKLLSRMEDSGKAREVVQMHPMFKASASDVINLYAFGDCMEFMDAPDWGLPYFAATDRFFGLTHVFALFPGIVAWAQSMPGWAVRLLAPSLSKLRDRQDWWVNKVREIRRSPNPERVKRTIFQGILESSLPPQEKADVRLADEAQLVIFAGEGTTAYALMCSVFHLLNQPEELQKLKAELRAACPDPNDILLSQVDNLPYLGAIIQETVRLHPGVMSRQVRTSPEVPVVYTDPHSGRTYEIPPHTVLSMSPLDTHTHAQAFGPDAHEWRPQRWIDDAKLSRYFIGFSRGTRGCLGMTLARFEMAFILATIFLRYDVYRGQTGPTLELYDTYRDRDIDANCDYIIPMADPGSKGLQVRVRN